MGRAAKRKGTRNEHRSRALLEAAGYRVTRAAGSFGEWDLIGLGPQGAVVVQVKTRDWPGTLEMVALRGVLPLAVRHAACASLARSPALPGRAHVLN